MSKQVELTPEFLSSLETTRAGAWSRARVLNIATVCMAVALPAMLLGNPFTYALLIVGLLLGVGATSSVSSVDATLRMIGHSRLAALVLATLLLLYVGIVFSAWQPDYAVRHWLVLVVLALCGGGFLHVFRQLAPAQVRLWLRWLSFGVLVAAVLALGIAVLEPWAMAHGWYGEKPWTQTKLRFFSSVLAVILPFCWLYWLDPARTPGAAMLQHPRYKLGLLLGCLSVVLVIVCAGRAGWMGVVAAGLVWLVMMRRFHGFYLPTAAQIVGLGALTLAGSGLGYTLLYGTASMEERIGMVVPARGLGGGRLDIWEQGLANLGDQPWFGIGVNNFRFIPGADYHPHNFLLQLLLEGGILGGGMALVMLVVLAAVVYRRGRENRLAAAGLAALAGFIVAALTNKSIFNPEWLVFLMMVSVVALTAAAPAAKAVPAESRTNLSPADIRRVSDRRPVNTSAKMGQSKRRRRRR